MFSPMHTPLTRAEFEERMNFMCEQLRMGMMKFAAGLRGTDSLLQVRYLPNGRIDLLSIDESARLQSNMSFQMRDQDLRDKLMKAANQDGSDGSPEGEPSA